jgi:hypothetical protein
MTVLGRRPGKRYRTRRSSAMAMSSRAADTGALKVVLSRRDDE